MSTSHTSLPIVEHEPESWTWSVSCDEASEQYPRWLNIYVQSAFGGKRYVGIDDGGDTVYLDRPRVFALVAALDAATAIVWPEEAA